MNFLAPLFLAGAAAAALPIVLHLLRREPEPRVKFPTVRLLKQAPVELTERRRLRELLLLALRVTALLLLALAFARPFFAAGQAMLSAGTTVVALDTSYSMSAPGRFERARQLARDAIDHAPSGDLVAVVTFDDGAATPVKATGDRALARSAVESAQAGYGGTRYRAGLAAAAQALGGRAGTIVVVTDLQAGGWDAGDRASVPDTAKIELADVGPAPDDFAVTAVQPAGARLIATVRNASSRARDAHVRLAVDGQPAGQTTVAVGPNATADATFELGGRQASSAAVSVDDPQGLQADNTRYAILGGGTRPSVLVVTATGVLSKDAFYVLHALEASAPGMDAFDVKGVSAAQLSGSGSDRETAAPGADDGARLRGEAAVLLLATRGLERRGREALVRYLREGGGLIVAAGPDVDGDVAADLLGDGMPLRMASSADARPVVRALAPADVRHPVFRPFAASAATLSLVKFRQIASIEGRGCQPIARFTTGEPAMIDCPAGDGRALVIASDLNDRWNDFPVHATFVPFLHESVRYVAGARPHASEYLIADAPAGVPAAPGIANVPAAGGAPARRVAINVDPREADPARIDAAEFQAAVSRLKDNGASEVRVEGAQQEERQHLWQYVLVLMFAALALEGMVASRTA